MQLIETPRMALCFNISEKYFCLSAAVCKLGTTGAALTPSLLTLRGPVMPFRSSADLTGAGGLAPLKMGCKSQHAGVLWMESKNLLGPWGTEQGQGQEAQGTRRGAAAGAVPPSFTHQEPNPRPRTSSRWTVKRLGIYLIHLPNTDFVPIDMFHIN